MADDDSAGHAVGEREGCQPKQASSFRKGHNIILKEKPCKVVEMSTSKTGKHGHAKVNFTGIDIFTNKKYKEIQGSTHPMLTFDSAKSEWGVMACAEDGTLSLIDEKGETRDDLSLPADEELAKAIKDNFEAGEKEVFVSVLSALGTDQIMSYVCRPFEDKA